MLLAERLRQVVTMSGHDVRAFAREVGMKERTLHEYLSGNRVPRADQLEKLAASGIDINWLLLGYKSPEVSINFSLPEGMKEVDGIVPAWPWLDSEVQSRAFKIVDDILMKKPDFLKEMGLIGIAPSIWTFYREMAQALDKHSETLLRARREGTPIGDIVALVLDKMAELLTERAVLVPPPKPAVERPDIGE